MWTAMMTAMMLPSITSMLVLFARVAGQRRAGKADRVPTWVFVCGYLTTWAILGFAAFAAARLVQWGLSIAPTLSRYNTEMAGLTLVVAGLYQLSPFKGNCLRHCRSPLDFILHSWRDGRWGALRMGSAHGLYCTGCCWGLMIVLFAVGLMNLAWMAALTVVMSVEKMSSHGLLIGRAAGLALLSLGVVLIVKSGVLPGLS
jgi:predicted metal-binding membrane protein